MVAFKVAPSQTPILIENTKDWARLHRRELAAWALGVVGVLFAIKAPVVESQALDLNRSTERAQQP
jgi:hypothetical protein